MHATVIECHILHLFSPPRVCIIFLIIQRPVINYSLLNAQLAIDYPLHNKYTQYTHIY